MKITTLILATTSILAFLASHPASAQIVNIDFLAQRTDSETPSLNYVGQGDAGGGTVFNGLAADNSASTDLITVAGANLQDAGGGATGIGFSIGPIGADHNGVGGATQTGIFNGGYLFLNSAGNAGVDSATFTITGLGSATTKANLFFYTNGSGYADSFTLPGGTLTAVPVMSIYTSANTIEYVDVPVSGGIITGSFDAPSGTAVYSGLTIEVPTATTPEPSTAGLLFLGVGILAGLSYLRRKNNLAISIQPSLQN